MARSQAILLLMLVGFLVAGWSEVEAQMKAKTIVVAHGVDLESLNPYWR